MKEKVFNLLRCFAKYFYICIKQVEKMENKPQKSLAQMSIKELANTDSIKAKFQEMIGDRAAVYLTSMVNAVSDNPQLGKCEPMSILKCGINAAALNLPIDKNLGKAWIVPYGRQAQFQIGWKGLVELCQRTGMYRKINVVNVYEGQLVSYDPFEEDIKLDHTAKTSEKVIGYYAMFELTTGFIKKVYWSVEDVKAHAQRFSKMAGKGVWASDFDAMARKTVLRNMLSKWGTMDININRAIQSDQAVINNADTLDVDYTDAIDQAMISSGVDQETGEVTGNVDLK